MADSKSIVESAGAEIKENPPKILAHTRKKFGAARAKSQRVGIMLSKARKLGAHIPKSPRMRRSS
jgi:hypothetical protein